MHPANTKLYSVNKILITISFILLFQNSFAQPTKAELEKLMKDQKELLERIKNDPNYKQQVKQQKNNTGVSSASSYADPGDYGNVDNWKFPAKNMAILASLPKRVLTRAELVSFLNEVYNRLSKKLPVGVSSSVQTIAAKYNNDGNKMGDVAVMGWYTNYREEALLLITKAAAINPDNGVLLNNCAALLNMSGVEQGAIPILKYILQSYPGNAMVLNNLGQAYAGLGETDTAMIYLGRCIKTEPQNVEANNTAGQIEAAKGNTEKAIGYFEQSIKGAYNKPAELKLRKIKKDEKISPLVKQRIKIPEYFNLFKYKLPAQCNSVDNATEADAAFRAFQETISVQFSGYGKKLTALQQQMYQENLKQADKQPAMPIIVKDNFSAQPYHEFCGIMLKEQSDEFGKEYTDITSRVDKKYFADKALLEKEYSSKLDAIKKDFIEKEKGCCGEGNTSCCISSETKCKAYDMLANQYLPKFAILTTDWQEKNQLVFTTWFDEVAYWSYLNYHSLPHGDDYFRLQSFYPMISNYLIMLGKIGQSKIIKPCDFVPITVSSDSNEIKEMKCPLDIEVPFIVGKFEFNCEKFSFSAGEGVVFGYEKNFKTKQSTLSVGIGVTLQLEAKAGPIKAGVSGEITETVFITFDGNNGIADVGLKNEAKASAGATGIGKTETAVGSSFGVNSGYNFTEGFLKGMIGPAPEVQLNKKVSIYKPSN